MLLREKTVINEWEEVDGTFVGNLVGGGGHEALISEASSKL